MCRYYRRGDQACRVQAEDGDRWRIDFDAPQRAVAPGQYVVLYDGDICLGGGTIDATWR